MVVTLAVTDTGARPAGGNGFDNESIGCDEPPPTPPPEPPPHAFARFGAPPSVVVIAPSSIDGPCGPCSLRAVGGCSGAAELGGMDTPVSADQEGWRAMLRCASYP